MIVNKSVGVGLRHSHFPSILEQLSRGEVPSIHWFEGISENFLHTRGRPFDILMKVREYFPLSLHGVSLNIASYEDLNLSYLKKLKNLYRLVEPQIVSDHLCWTGLPEHNAHNLLPFSYDKENLEFIANKIHKVQEIIGRPMAFENLSAYMVVETSEMSEAEFLKELCLRTGCQLLLDINNVYVNSYNQGFDPEVFIETLPLDNVVEVHLAGYTDMGEFLFDTHGGPIHEEVWRLYEWFCEKYQKPTLVEWDENIPSFERLIEEANKVKKIKGFSSE